MCLTIQIHTSAHEKKACGWMENVSANAEAEQGAVAEEAGVRT